MSDDKTVTEREAVLREREAFLQGISCKSYFPVEEGTYWHAESQSRYPLPTITRPRVVKDPHKANTSWRCKDGLLWYSWTNKENPGWYTGTVLWNPTPERVRLWADLLANPTEEVTE